MATYLPNSYSETPITPSNIRLFMNSGSYSNAFSGNSQEQNNCFVIPSISSSHSTPDQREILTNIGGLQTGDHDFTAWREGRNEMLVTHPMDGQNLRGQALSLSLGTQIPSGIQMPPFHDRSTNPSFDSFLGPNPSILGNGGHRSGSSRQECLRHSEFLQSDLPEGNQELNREDYSLHGMLNVASNGPNSKYFKAAQQLLDEVVDIQKAIIKRPNVKSHSTHENSKKTPKEDGERLENERATASNPQDSASNSSCELSLAEKQDLQHKLTKLLSILDEVESRYKQYYHQMKIVVSSFDVIAGCGAAKPYTALALQTISRHFRCLRDAITGQIGATQKSLGEQDTSGNNKGAVISRLRHVDQQIRQQRALQQLGVMQHAWRPQRGLPESSVSILRAWLFEHFLNPYPKDSDKIMLARQTGLTRSQVSNWFINARVRLWKPMIEEMYKEEIGDADTDSSSSSENASKVTKSDVKTSDDRFDDLQQSQISNKNSNGGQAKNFRSDNVLDTEIMGITGIASLHHGGREGETEYGIVKQTGEQRPNFDDCSLFPDDTVVQSGGGSGGFMVVASTCQTPELGRFETRNGVSLTLGLQHCEGGNFMPGETHHGFVVMREDGIYNAAAAEASTIGAGTADLESVSPGNQQQRFSSPHLLHDFVV